MPKIKIISRVIEHPYIKVVVKVNGTEIIIKFTLHSAQRAKVWQLEENEIINTIIIPDEVVIGHSNRFIAHKVKNSKIIRVVYEYRNKIPYVIDPSGSFFLV